MQNACSSERYAVISPVRDEENYVESTIRSVLGQTVRPCKWVIVDDGSSDRTAEILDSYARLHNWILVVRLNRNTGRVPGTAVIRAFRAGYAELENESAEFVVKLDCDVELPSDYFENLLAKFGVDPSLGIASGVYAEQETDEWEPVPMPAYHAAGACKMMRMECFRQIGGFVQAQGWDTVDEIKAQALGWKTQHFPQVQFYHLKKEGSGIGALATSLMHGRVYYLTGGGKLFFLLKVLHRIAADKPFLLSGLALLAGYLKAMLSREPKLVTKQEARSYGRQLNRRIWDSLPAFWRAPQQRHSWSGK